MSPRSSHSSVVKAFHACGCTAAETEGRPSLSALWAQYGQHGLHTNQVFVQCTPPHARWHLVLVEATGHVELVNDRPQLGQPARLTLELSQNCSRADQLILREAF